MKKTKSIIAIFVFIFLTSCTSSGYKQPNNKWGAEATADKFGREWEQKNYANMYDMFIPDLQKKKNKADFIALMNYLEKESHIVIRLDKISLEDNKTAYAYYTANSSLFDVKAPAIKLEYNKGMWQFNAFTSYFSMDLDERKYCDKIEEGLGKYVSLLNKHVYDVKTVDDSDVFLDNATELLKIKADMLGLEVPKKYKKYHEAFLNTFDNIYKSIIANKDFCLAKNIEEKEKYRQEAIEYANLAELPVFPQGNQ